MMYVYIIYHTLLFHFASHGKVLLDKKSPSLNIFCQEILKIQIKKIQDKKITKNYQKLITIAI